MSRLYVIGIGGTGMRCLEAFVHTCAMGMYDNTEIEMLALDTDRDNGNFKRLKELVDAYNKAKGVDKDRFAIKDSFFTAKINFYQFSPDYSRQSTGNFARIFHYNDLRREKATEADLADLLFTKRTREFDLKHGYRAQTSLGSLLMYHGIVDEVERNHDGELGKYINNLVNANQVEPVKVFVLGSVFGGTGASSIPVIPKAFAAAARIITPGIAMDNVYFGAGLLTSYFTFKNPSSDYVERQMVVATADKFALNSQAAMMFYDEDNTVKNTYQQFYLMGTPGNEFVTDQGEADTITGGEQQKNNSHYVELFAACSIYNFFHKEDNDALEKIKSSKDGVKYYFRTIEDNGELFFEDFVHSESVERFAKGFGLLTVLSLLEYEASLYNKTQQGLFAKDHNIFGFENIDEREIRAIRKYFELFNFRADNSKVEDGWLRQVSKSTGGKFVFKPELIGCNTPSSLKKFKYNKDLFKRDFSNHHYSTGFFSNKFDTFMKHFQATENSQNITNHCERLTKRLHDALCKVYGFKI